MSICRALGLWQCVGDVSEITRVKLLKIGLSSWIELVVHSPGSIVVSFPFRFVPEEVIAHSESRAQLIVQFSLQRGLLKRIQSHEAAVSRGAVRSEPIPPVEETPIVEIASVGEEGQVIAEEGYGTAQAELTIVNWIELLEGIFIITRHNLRKTCSGVGLSDEVSIDPEFVASADVVTCVDLH